MNPILKTLFPDWGKKGYQRGMTVLALLEDDIPRNTRAIADALNKTWEATYVDLHRLKKKSLVEEEAVNPDDVVYPTMRYRINDKGRQALAQWRAGGSHGPT